VLAGIRRDRIGHVGCRQVEARCRARPPRHHKGHSAPTASGTVFCFCIFFSIQNEGGVSFMNGEAWQSRLLPQKPFVGPGELQGRWGLAPQAAALDNFKSAFSSSSVALYLLSLGREERGTKHQK